MNQVADWEVVGTGSEGAPISVGGINPWNARWQAVSAQAIMLPHPQYSRQLHEFHVYQIDANGKLNTFAAAELSPGIWGFYVPRRLPLTIS